MPCVLCLYWVLEIWIMFCSHSTSQFDRAVFKLSIQNQPQLEAILNSVGLDRLKTAPGSSNPQLETGAMEYFLYASANCRQDPKKPLDMKRPCFRIRGNPDLRAAWQPGACDPPAHTHPYPVNPRELQCHHGERGLKPHGDHNENHGPFVGRGWGWWQKVSSG